MFCHPNPNFAFSKGYIIRFCQCHYHQHAKVIVLPVIQNMQGLNLSMFSSQTIHSLHQSSVNFLKGDMGENWHRGCMLISLGMFQMMAAVAKELQP